MECPREFYRWSDELGYADCQVTVRQGVIFVGDLSDLICVGDLPACVKVRNDYVEFSSWRLGVRVSEWEVAGALYGLLKSGIKRPQYYLIHLLSGEYKKEQDLEVPLHLPYAVVHMKPKGFQFRGLESLAKVGDEALRLTGFPYGLVISHVRKAIELGRSGKLKLTASGLYGDALLYKGYAVILSTTLEELKRKASIFLS